MRTESTSSIDRKHLLCYVEVRFFGRKVFKRRFYGNDGDVKTANASHALRQLNKIIGWCIAVLFTLCVIILAFAVQQTLIAREKRAEVANLYQKTINCQLVVEDLNAKIRKLQLNVTELESGQNVRKKILKLDNESELREARATFFNANSVSGWLLLKYVGPKTVHFTAGGEGTADEIKDQLEDDQIEYILIREQVDGQPRDIFIAWIGPSVGTIEKEKKAAFQGDAESLLQPYHSVITASNKDKFNDANIIDRSNNHVID